MKDTIVFDEKNNGWETRFTYYPEQMQDLNDRLFSFKNGNLYEHEKGANARTFYDQKDDCSITTVINDANQYDKIFKTLELESNQKWSALFETNITNGHLDEDEFNQKESRWFASLHKNEDTEDLTGNVLLGIGVNPAFSGTSISFNEIPWGLNVGDDLYQIQNDNPVNIGSIKSFTNNTIVVNSLTNALSNGFCYAQKPARIEGGEHRGYYLKVKLTYNGEERVELFGLTTNAVQSFLK